MEEMQLRQIIDKKEIRSVYQPIVSLEDGSVFGYEALARITNEECKFILKHEDSFPPSCTWHLI